jgi:hypothetical protein
MWRLFPCNECKTNHIIFKEKQQGRKLVDVWRRHGKSLASGISGESITHHFHNRRQQDLEATNILPGALFPVHMMYADSNEFEWNLAPNWDYYTRYVLS